MTKADGRALLIFDCDGTLVDSEYLCNVAMETCLGEIGVVESATSLLSRYRGAKLDNILTDISLRHGRVLPPKFVDGYRSSVSALFEKELHATEGVSAALTQIKTAKCVASSGPVSKIKQALDLTHLARFFEERIYSSYLIQSWKPEPGLFLHAASVEGYRPSECIVIEDSLLGIEAAKRAGMAFLLYDPDDIYLDVDLPSDSRFSSMATLPALVQRLAHLDVEDTHSRGSSIGHAGGQCGEREASRASSGQNKLA